MIKHIVKIHTEIEEKPCPYCKSRGFLDKRTFCPDCGNTRFIEIHIKTFKYIGTGYLEDEDKGYYYFSDRDEEEKDGVMLFDTEEEARMQELVEDIEQ